MTTVLYMYVYMFVLRRSVIIATVLHYPGLFSTQLCSKMCVSDMFMYCRGPYTNIMTPSVTIRTVDYRRIKIV